jgi:hypothetical protein
MFVGGAVEGVLGAACALDPKLNRLVEDAVGVALPAAGALVLVPNMLFCGVSCCVALPFCALAPNPLKRLFCAGAVLLCAVPSPPNMLLVAGVPAGFEVVAPKEKGVGAGAGVLVAFAAELEAPNMLFEGAPMLPPNMLPVLGALVVVFCERPANGLLGACELNIDPAPKAEGVPLPLPLIAGAGALLAAKGLLLPAVKLKSFTVGG